MRDANGNVLALYEGKASGLHVAPETIVLKETIIYGSSRIGQYRGFKNDAAQGEFNKKTALGQRIYEFSNHLGNVLVTLTDHKLPQTEGGYKSFVLSASDYYPFGLAMTERTYQNGEYRFGFQGQEHDEETGTDHYTYRQADPKIGRFWSLDPLAPKYPHNSPYAFSENRVLDGIELEGAEWKPIHDADGNITDYEWVGYETVYINRKSKTDNRVLSEAEYQERRAVGFAGDFEPVSVPKQGSVPGRDITHWENGFEVITSFGVDNNKKGVIKQQLRAPWLYTARNELGVSEIANEVHSARVMEYHNTTLFPPDNDDDKGPWCASFCNWVLSLSDRERGHSSWSLYWAYNYKQNGMVSTRT